ncbi:MAG: hypothetical protein ACJ768_01725 [Gaiellaceae bacterium]
MRAKFLSALDGCEPDYDHGWDDDRDDAPPVPPPKDPYHALPWRRSKKGNSWAELPDGRRVTVFPVGGQWSYCIADQSGPQYCPLKFTSEMAAMQGLLNLLRNEGDTCR